MKYKLVILSYLIFLGCSEDSNPIYDGDEVLNFVGTEETLDIVTWNIEWFPKDELTVNYVKDITISINADIIAMQEIADTEALNSLEDLLPSGWNAYRANSGDWGELAYLINSNNITVYSSPYTILNAYGYEFAWREPYVLEFTYNNEEFYLINVHYKCCDGSEDRRVAANVALHSYIQAELTDKNVIVVGDYNDELIDENNVFDIFLAEEENFLFSDLHVAAGPFQYWSYPSWPSHIDHILISNELFDNEQLTATILVDNSMEGYFDAYEQHVSDHRPVGIKLYVNP